MREILFRGKRVDNGEWVEGYYLSLGVDIYSCGECIGSKDEHYIIRPCHEDFNYENTFEITLETLSQYTGLKDRNGMMIFEGDNTIIRDEPDEIWTVKWDDGELQWGLESETVCVALGSYYSYELEIVGNVHDGKEDESN